MASLRSLRLGIRSDIGLNRPSSLKVTLADNFWRRLIGLLLHRSLPNDEALLLVPCASIHTFGMRIAIDVIFLDKQNKVLGFSDHVVPYRIRSAPKGTVKVLEIAQGNRMRTGINLDDYLVFD